MAGLGISKKTETALSKAAVKKKKKKNDKSKTKQIDRPS